MEVEVDLYATNPGPIDGSVLYDQDKHVSTAVWDGQVEFAIRHPFMLYFFCKIFSMACLYVMVLS